MQFLDEDYKQALSGVNLLASQKDIVLPVHADSNVLGLLAEFMPLLPMGLQLLSALVALSLSFSRSY
ncbi:hypothetical protein ACTXT7_002038 [Hymenolepis weldensis]